MIRLSTDNSEKLDCKTVRTFAYSSKCEQSSERSRVLHVCNTLTPRSTDFLTDFEKKTDCFTV